MVKSWVQLGERLLSGRGRFKFPSLQPETIRAVQVSTVVVRDSTTQYVSLKYQPNESFYGHFTWLRNGYVVKTDSIRFKRQQFTFNASESGILQRQLACVNQEILRSILNLGVSLGLPPIQLQNETKAWKIAQLCPDELQFVCYGSCGIYVDVQGIDYDECEELDGDEPPPEPPLPPEPPQPVPPTQPLPIDPPYDDDDPSTYDPAPIDEIPVPRPGLLTYTLFARGIPGTSSQGSDIQGGTVYFALPSADYIFERVQRSVGHSGCSTVPQYDFFAVSTNGQPNILVHSGFTCHDLQIQSYTIEELG